MPEALLVLSNVPDMGTAEAIARGLLQQRLAACVNILPAVRSLYRWKDSIEDAGEVTMLIKSTRGHYAEIERAIGAQHPYDVPEIIAIPISAGLPAYLSWIADETRKDVDV
ncbi:divalent-cation tolerance protein CutA [Noviherbaspirillum sp. Root189]|uniref:divalent-cation tolerance protein CutA n=1 Tax=Noviherbaspirillum sp. Root189 TaxID=1736487 RepID=UPI00070CC0B0|nr:cation tolerance protein CutA [Noviherbaspirillum sp. Root189]